MCDLWYTWLQNKFRLRNNKLKAEVDILSEGTFADFKLEYVFVKLILQPVCNYGKQMRSQAK